VGKTHLQARRHVALLRGINVGGHAVVTMSKLKGYFEAIGLEDVKTYIQSGNVLFTSTAADTARLTLKLEKHLEQCLGHTITVFLLSHGELKEAATNNPLDPVRLDAERASHLVFLSEPPAAAKRKALEELEDGVYSFRVRGRVLYFSYPRKLAGKRKTFDLERLLGVTATARTWKVVDKLVELSAP
jgi:uncharacterized protein (DUF1697 family)